MRSDSGITVAVIPLSLLVSDYKIGEINEKND